MPNELRNAVMLGGLRRPEYLQAPESFLTSLSWNGWALPMPDDGVRPIALVFQDLEPTRSSTTLTFRHTWPSEEGITTLGARLRELGVSVEERQDSLALAVMESILGVEGLKKRSRSAVPLTAHVGRLQNLRGVAAKKNPADVGKILEQIFQLGLIGLGHEPGDEEHTAADRWYRASAHRAEGDMLLAAIDQAVTCLLPAEPEPRRVEPSLWDGGVHEEVVKQSPFTWFAKSWSDLTSPAWVTALPARVWADWATTVLRLGFGMAYLWEAAWIESIAKAVVAREGHSVASVRRTMRAPVDWAPRSAAPSVRDVSPLLRQRLSRASALRVALGDWIEANGDGLGFEEGLARMSADDDLWTRLVKLLGSDPKFAKNMWEAVKFTLAVRQESGRTADYYGLLRSNHRFTFIDPGPEWIAVISALAAGAPRVGSTVRQLARSLDHLGLTPQVEDLIGLLEEAGLARGSADADDAVLIEAAF